MLRSFIYLVAILLLAACSSLAPNTAVQTVPILAPSYSLPGIDEGVFSSGVNAQAWYKDCKNEPSGPYYRIQTNHNSITGGTGPVNSLSANVFLPDAKMDGTNTPYLYLGGQARNKPTSASPQSGTETDAGLYVDNTGMWTPFMVLKDYSNRYDTPIRETVTENGQTKTYTYRLEASQTASVQLWTPANNQLSLRLS